MQIREKNSSIQMQQIGKSRKPKRKAEHVPFYFQRSQVTPAERRAPAQGCTGGQGKLAHTGQAGWFAWLVSSELLNSLNTRAQTISKLLVCFAML